MKKALVIPYYNSLNQTKICWLINSRNEYFSQFNQIILIDNGDTDGTSEWIQKYIISPHTIITNKDNIGSIPSLQQGYEAVNPDIDYIVYMHNDVLLVDRRNLANTLDPYFDIINKWNAGVVGLFGAEKLETNGGRSQCWGAVLEDGLEGNKIKDSGFQQVILLDGLFLAVRKKLLDDIGGWDLNYTYHHFYDKDISMESIKHGYKNYVIDIPYYHLNGQTSNQNSYQDWINKKMEVNNGDILTHQKSEQYFLEKWKDYLGKRYDEI